MLRNILIIILLIVFQSLIFTVCWAKISEKSDPSCSLKYIPCFSESLIASNQDLISGDLNEEELNTVRHNIERALRLTPLSDKLFLQYILANTDEADKASDINLLGDAKSRNHRNISTSQLLLKYYLNESDVQSAIFELDFLLKYNEKNRGTYFQVLTNLAYTPEGESAILQYAKENNSWIYSFLFYQIREKSGLALLELEDLITEHLKSNTDLRQTRALKSRFLTKLFRAGNIQDAYSIWKKWESIENRLELVFDSEFKGLTAPSPFNWVMTKTNDTFAEIEPPSGLLVSSRDTESKVAIYQIMPVTENQNMKLISNARWDYSDAAGYFEWSISCVNSNNIIARVKFSEDNRLAGLASEDFMVPSNCTYINLQLLAVPGRLARRISAKIDSVKISANR